MDEMYIIIASKIKIWQVIFFFNCGLFFLIFVNVFRKHSNLKHWYENKVIVVLLIHCHPLETKYCWPYVIESRLNGLNYILNHNCFKDKNMASHFFFQLWIIFSDLCQCF
jgi:hypothetical protein